MKPPQSCRAISLDKPLTIAILAMGGQGGGVLADWIVEVAEHEGWAAQSTSVPGVAQRTGATIYYIETLPPRNGVAPVFSLMPTPGDVDVVMAAELMEAGRSVLRGLVTPDKTTLIASTHRAYAVAEKEKPGDGAGDPFVVVDALDFAARRTIAFDMEKLAVERGTVISAPMLGALAGSGALPFERSAYEAIVRKGARGANASLAAFADAYDRARAGEHEAPKTGPVKRLDDLPDDAGHPELNRLVARLRSDLPESARPLAFAGLKRIVDFQDVAYGDDYIDRLKKLAALDAANGGAAKTFAFTAEAAKRLAVAMAYDDVIRVADIKLRPSRFARLREEAGAAPDQLVYATEYLHPRGEEICGMMPASLGAFIEAQARSLFRMLDRIVNRGRRVPVGRIGGFLQLYGVAALRPTRRSSLRHKRETAHLRGMARASGRHPAEELRSRGRGPALPAAGQGLFRHACAGLEQVRPRDGEGAEARVRARTARNGWRGSSRRRSWTNRARRSTASRRRSTRFRVETRSGRSVSIFDPLTARWRRAKDGRVWLGENMVEAPGWPGIPARWTSSAKDGVGTALSERSRVWFTISHGIVNEIYYPRVDQACVRDLGLIVTDGDTFFAEVKRDCQTVVERIEDGVPAFRLTSTHRGGRFRMINRRDHGPAQQFGRSAHSPRRFLQDRAARVRLAGAASRQRRGAQQRRAW